MAHKTGIRLFPLVFARQRIQTCKSTHTHTHTHTHRHTHPIKQTTQWQACASWSPGVTHPLTPETMWSMVFVQGCGPESARAPSVSQARHRSNHGMAAPSSPGAPAAAACRPNKGEQMTQAPIRLDSARRRQTPKIPSQAPASHSAAAIAAPVTVRVLSTFWMNCTRPSMVYTCRVPAQACRWQNLPRQPADKPKSHA